MLKFGAWGGIEQQNVELINFEGGNLVVIWRLVWYCSYVVWYSDFGLWQAQDGWEC
jgi:hypothetical protein